METCRRPARRFLLILAALAGWGVTALCPALLHAGEGIYFFTDERGVSHYTNTPNDPRFRPAKLPTTTRRKIAGRSPSVPAFPGKALSPLHMNRTINAAARSHALDPSLIKAVIQAESGGDIHAVSPKGALGLMQLMPGTAADLSIANPLDPVSNIWGGTTYLRQMLDRFDGDLILALAAYNAGPGAVEKNGGVPPYPETVSYVRKVLSLWGKAR